MYRGSRAVPRGKNHGGEQTTTNVPLTISIATGFVLPLFGGCAAPQPLVQGKNYINLVGDGIVPSDYPKERLTKQTGHPVLGAFNEFCSPTLEETIDEAVNQGTERVVVITTMMTPGGAHSEVDIPKAVEAAAKRHPTVEIVYAWPYDFDRIAATFADQTRRFNAR